jgi:hypothetical protein
VGGASSHIRLPDLLRLRQVIAAPRLHDAPASLEAALAEFDLERRVARGQRVAVAVGSRGIRDLVPLLVTLVAALRRVGAEPYLVPCMGSHGGATAAGQAAVLAELGVTESSVGAPVVSTMDALEVGTSRYGAPLWASPDLVSSDGVILVNRIKPHTDFSGPIESGIAKMLVIGAGKHRGAVEAHRLFVRHGFSAVIEECGRALLERLPVLFGLAVIENQLDETAELHLLERDEVLEREPALLRRARELMPALRLSRLDCLVVDEMGKDVSGSGMDTNVIGRKQPAGGAAAGPEVTRIFVRDITPASDGNALGVGFADFVTTRLAAAVDPEVTMINALTAMAPEAARLPLAFDDDVDALAAAYATSGAASMEEFRMAWIRNTLDVGELLVSEALSGEVAADPAFEVCEGPFPFPLDSDGRFAPCWGAGRVAAGCERERT